MLRVFVKYLILTLTLFGGLGCSLKNQIFGGSEQSETAQSISLALLNSEAVLFRGDSDRLNLTGANINRVLNQFASDLHPLGSLDLLPDTSAGGSLASSWMRFQPTVTDRKYRTPALETMEFEQFSVVVVAKTSSRGTLVSFDPSDELSEAYSLRISSTNIIGRFTSSSGNYMENVWATPVGDAVVAIASFSAGELSFQLVVNGNLVSGSTVVGSPSFPFIVNRSLSVGPNAVTDQVDIKRIYAFNRALSKTEMGALTLYLAELDSITDISLDPTLSINPGKSDPNFAGAQKVINESCARCHSGWNNATAKYFVKQGKVTKGSPESSPLYYRILGSSGGNGPKNMPASGSISGADADLIKKWILQMP